MKCFICNKIIKTPKVKGVAIEILNKDSICVKCNIKHNTLKNWTNVIVTKEKTND